MQCQSRLLERAKQDAHRNGGDPEKAVTLLKNQQKRAAPFINFVTQYLQENKMKLDIRTSKMTSQDESVYPCTTMGERAIYQEAFNKGLAFAISHLDLDKRER